MGRLKYNFQNLAIFEMVPKKFINPLTTVTLPLGNTLSPRENKNMAAAEPRDFLSQYPGRREGIRPNAFTNIN